MNEYKKFNITFDSKLETKKIGEMVNFLSKNYITCKIIPNFEWSEIEFFAMENEAKIFADTFFNGGGK
jgi:hypothetical protein